MISASYENILRPVLGSHFYLEASVWYIISNVEPEDKKTAKNFDDKSHIHDSGCCSHFVYYGWMNIEFVDWSIIKQG